MYGDLEIDYSLEVWYSAEPQVEIWPDGGEEWEDRKRSNSLTIKVSDYK